MHKWTVFGGWAIPPEELALIFGSSSRYIDINKHMGAIIKNGTLVDNWEYLLQNLFFPETHHPLFLAGWSTGAIIAIALAQLLKPDALVLLSPTLSFCRRDNFRYGLRSTTLNSMILALENDKDSVLEQFFLNCGLKQKRFTNTYSSDELRCGLQFLAQVHLKHLHSLQCPVLCFHGKQDRIIPVNAGRTVCEILEGIMYETSGSHVFFQQSSNEIISTIESIMR